MMRIVFRLTVIGLALLAVSLVAGCSDDNPLASFEPEIVNNPDAFEFQITDADNVNTSLTYAWSNSTAQATIDHSTVTADGSASVVIRDAAGTEVYSSELKASGTEQASAGVPGLWTINVAFNDYSGTSNFRVQAL